ncbi:MAG: hypothetical protein JXK93_09190 [Sphaerochaetaceae bacterium]|nr:hypothetical protein [Sphaerochaetaceae bacterium]
MKRLLFWLTRGLMVVYILFISLFALDSFDSAYSTSQQLISFMIHIAPSVLLAVTLFFAWKRPLVGAAGFLVMSVFFTILVHGPSGGIGFYILVIPALIGSFMFCVESIRTKRHGGREHNKSGGTR